MRAAVRLMFKGSDMLCRARFIERRTMAQWGFDIYRLFGRLGLPILHFSSITRQLKIQSLGSSGAVYAFQ